MVGTTHPFGTVALVAIETGRRRAKLKERGFKWSPTFGAWQRYRSNQAKYIAEYILGAENLVFAPVACEAESEAEVSEHAIDLPLGPAADDDEAEITSSAPDPASIVQHALIF